MTNRSQRTSRVRHRSRLPTPDVDETPSDYEVGYRKPPKSTQFRKGQSGNPKGRPKQVKNISTFLDQELSTDRTVRVDGVARKRNTRQLIVLSLIKKAINGDVRAIKELMAQDDQLRRDAEALIGQAADGLISRETDRAIIDSSLELYSASEPAPAPDANATHEQKEDDDV